ncbi:Putative ribosome biogenesis GTPase RsgA [Chlamydiales bacterium SCGC AG-110-M15]|nr:Putative ribosome biogenesis GTPase RsgA [Chlamydiales bacterium SCGC AG-110-M15]
MTDEYIEEELFPEMRKESRLERKIASRTDRSKYKKSDQDQKQKHSAKQSLEENDKLLRGRVLSIKGLDIIVDCDGTQHTCVIPGIFKKDRTRKKNLLIVGDFVLFDPTSKGEGVVRRIEERHSIFSRADNISRRREQYIAANIDQVLITVSLLKPHLKHSLIDRYIIATLQGNMKPIIIINKIDLLDDEDIPSDLRDEERMLFQEVLKVYHDLNIPIIPISAETGEGLDKLKVVMSGKASVFSGQSGVGKSSLINAATGLDFETNAVVSRTGKGSHTTTSASLVPLSCGGWCIDTPGISSFGIWDLKVENVEAFFEEIHEYGAHCKFSNCSHRHEPDCAVMEAVENEEISPLRYGSYCTLIESIEEKHRPR